MSTLAYFVLVLYDLMEDLKEGPQDEFTTWTGGCGST